MIYIIKIDLLILIINDNKVMSSHNNDKESSKKQVSVKTDLSSSESFTKVFDIAGNDVTDLVNNKSIVCKILDFAGNDLNLMFNDHEIINN
jgi:hypothetical protein